MFNVHIFSIEELDTTLVYWLGIREPLELERTSGSS